MNKILARFSFDGTQRIRTWKKLAAQTRHGLDLDQALRLMRDRMAVKHDLAVQVYDDALTGLASGHNLGTSLAPYITAEEVMLINGGQNSGRLHEGLLLSAELLQARQKIFAAVAGALAYPLLLLVLVLVLLVITSVFVVPNLATFSNPEQWDGAARILYLTANFVNSFLGIAVFTVLGIGMALTVLSFPLWTGRARIFFDRMPPWSIYRLTVGSVWLFTVSTLMRSGMQLTHILAEMLRSPSTTPWLRERVQAVRQEFEAGKNIAEALNDTGMRWPDPDLVDDLRVYATLPGFHSRLHELAQEWMADGVERIGQQAKILNTVSIILIMALASLIALAIGSLQQQLSNTMGGM